MESDINPDTVKVLNHWININDTLSDDFRDNLITTAWQHFPHANNPLKSVAQDIFARHLQLNGFRPKGRIVPPINRVGPLLTQRMGLVTEITAIMVGLWAEAQADCIERLRTAILDAGLYLDPNWGLHLALIGYYGLDDLPIPSDLIDSLAQDDADRQMLTLAALWLSTAISTEPPIETFDDDFDWEPEQEPAPIIEPEAVLDSEPLEILPPELEAPMIEPAVEPTVEWSLTEIQEQLKSGMTDWYQARDLVNDAKEAVQDALKNIEITRAQAETTRLQTGLQDWQTSEGKLLWVIQRSADLLPFEVTQRADLDPDEHIRSLLATIPTLAIGGAERASALLDVVEQVMAYDFQRSSLLEQLRDVVERISALQSDLKLLISAEALQADNPDLRVDEDATLTTLNSRLRILQTYQRHQESRLHQYISAMRDRILGLATRLIEEQADVDMLVGDRLSLGGINSDRLGRLKTPQLQPLEQRLARLLDELIENRREKSAEIIHALREQWDETTMLAALTELAREKRNAEVFLLFVCAGFSEAGLPLMLLDGRVVDGLMQGIEQLSDGESLFSTLNLVVPYLPDAWLSVDANTKAKLCMMMLGADYTSQQRLPPNFLWQLDAQHWPLGGMPSWSALWEMALVNPYLPSLTSDQAARETLTEARAAAALDVAFENGAYIKVRSVKSRRHTTMLNAELMPGLAGRVLRIQGLEREINGLNLEQLQRAMPRIEKEISNTLRGLSPHDLQEQYDDAAQKDGVKDQDSFHKRTCLKLMEDCAESALAYGDALLVFARLQAERGHDLTEEQLLAELQSNSELASLGRRLIDHLSAVENKAALPEWNRDNNAYLAANRLAGALLSHETFVRRLPRTVSALIEQNFSLDQWLPSLLDDLAQPANAPDAAQILMSSGAYQQVLHLTQHIPLEMQKNAQALFAEKQRLVTTLENDLLKVGGEIDDLQPARELGRWGVVERELEGRIQFIQDDTRSKGEQIKQRARQVLRDVNALEEEINFEIGSTLPPDLLDLVNQGLEIVQRGAKALKILEEGEEFLRDIRYRLSHQSWPLGELQISVSRLENQLTGSYKPTAGSKWTVEQVLERFEKGELQALGISPSQMEDSEINTRSHLLHNWLAVRQINDFYNADLKSQAAQSVRALFRYFAQMNSMRHRPDGVQVEYDPTIHEYHELRFPRTSVLGGTCVLIALPGNPRQHINELEPLLDHKEWMPGYFVMVFVPGCTPEIRKRLETSYRHQGLIVIDDTVLLDMVLANASGSRPLYRLRSHMLNAIDTEGVDIFKVNQLVHPRTAIFVGRDSLVNRLVSSGKNHALYGGRRIGKSSVLAAVEESLKNRPNVQVVWHSFEGDSNYADNASATKLAQLVDFSMGLRVRTVDDFKSQMQQYMDARPELSLVLLLDEIDRYIYVNKDRHLLIETLRTLSERYPGRLRLIVSGFMGLYDCLNGAGPYTPTSDPWQRMFDAKNLGNLEAQDAEEIVREGFANILGWRFKNRTIPQRVIEYTGAHPAFVQKFCLQLQGRVSKRGDKTILLEDLQAVFDDNDPEDSFIAYVGKTLEMNLDPIGRYLTLWLAMDLKGSRGFTFDQMREYADAPNTSIPEAVLKRSIDQLIATSVVKGRGSDTYEFSVPDYPTILNRLGETSMLNQLEAEIAKLLTHA